MVKRLGKIMERLDYMKDKECALHRTVLHHCQLFELTRFIRLLRECVFNLVGMVVGMFVCLMVCCRLLHCFFYVLFDLIGCFYPLIFRNQISRIP